MTEQEESITSKYTNKLMLATTAVYRHFIAKKKKVVIFNVDSLFPLPVTES